ncbi:MAG: PilT/PilU family type 4a pilus ATPase [Candidatus Absconditabacteria bacterium]
MERQGQIYDLIREVIKHNVSDIHIEQDSPLCIRNASGKIIFQEQIITTKEDVLNFLNETLGESAEKVFAEGREVDSSFNLDGTFFRYNVYYCYGKINIALRKINSIAPSFEQIGLSDSIKQLLDKDKGLILVTGPTGSGKSTTMASLVEYINLNRSVHIITMEDPIEFVFQRKKSLISQREIGKDSKAWTDAIKYAMRQDPDVIMVGEMRDVETISSVLTLVETGHLVISTLHTSSAAQTINRILDIFPAYKQDQVAMQLSNGLLAIISQKLFSKKDGKGRVAARDIMVNVPGIAKNIQLRDITKINAIMETGLRHGMITMNQNLAQLVSDGLVSMEEIQTSITDKEQFNRILASRNERDKFNPID